MVGEIGHIWFDERRPQAERWAVQFPNGVLRCGNEKTALRWALAIKDPPASKAHKSRYLNRGLGKAGAS